MKIYRVISPYCLRDEKGELNGRHAHVGDEVDLSPADAHRLIKARCVMEVEDETTMAPENRVVRRRGRDSNPRQ